MIYQNDGVEGIWLLATPTTAEIHDGDGTRTHLWDLLPASTGIRELEAWAAETGHQPRGSWRLLGLQHLGTDLVGSGLPLEPAT